MTNWKNKYGYHLLFAVMAILILVIGSSISYSTDSGLDASLDLDLDNKEILNSEGREELQRYFGYEKLLFRYLTVPFDLTIGNNQLGRFLDVGFLVFAFIPIFLLLRFRNSTFKILILGTFMFGYLSICMNNTQIIDYQNKKTINPIDYPTDYSFPNSITEGFTSYLLVQLKYITAPTYRAVDSVVRNMSRDKDYITYPLISLFILYLFFLLYKDQKYNLTRLVLGAAISYGFFWLTLSAGIVWYGFLLLVICLLYFGVFVNDNFRLGDHSQSKIISYVGLTFLVGWVVLGFFSRVSNIPPMMTGSDLAKNMLNKSMSDFAVGKLSDEVDILNAVHPGLSPVIAQINADKGTNVLKIGTSFTSLINNNKQRVHSDDQLAIIKWMDKIYKDQETMTDVLKTSNFKYIIVDLNLMSIDQTPEKTLTDKYHKLIKYLYQNPFLKLLNTDRIVQNDTVDGGRTRNVFGPIIYGGSYAIYEIQ